MDLSISNRALAGLGAVGAGAVLVVGALHMSYTGADANEWLPQAAFGVLFPTLYLVPASVNWLRPSVTARTKRVGLVAVFGLWLVVGGVLFVAGVRDPLVSLFLAVGVVGELVLAVRSPAAQSTA